MSLSLFCSYFNQKTIPSFIKYYLFEIKRHVDDVILVTNKKKLLQSELELLNSQGIRILFVKNKGYDFGMYYQAMQEFEVSGYDEITLSNDSCYLINKLDPFFEWFRKSDLQMAGLLDSTQGDYHIQSYFLSFKGLGVTHLREYLKQNKIIRNKSAVINTYEVGLSTSFSAAGLKLGSYYQSKDYSVKPGLNPAIFQIHQLIRAGFPLIKRKLLVGGYTRSDLIFFAKNGLVIDSHQLKHLILETNPELTLNHFD